MTKTEEKLGRQATADEWKGAVLVVGYITTPSIHSSHGQRESHWKTWAKNHDYEAWNMAASLAEELVLGH